MKKHASPTRKVFTQREALWIYRYLNNNRKLGSKWLKKDFATYDECLMAIEKVRAQAGGKEIIISAMEDLQYNFLPDIEFEWIKGDRILYWLYHMNQRTQRYPFMRSNLSINEIKKEYIDTLDRDGRILDKREYHRNLQREWSNILSQSGRYNWIDAKDSEQVEWVWGYIKERCPNLEFYCPTDLSGIYICIISVFDCWQGGLEDQKSFLSRMRKSWGQWVGRQSR